MNIDDTLRDHYRSVDIDDAAQRRLQSVITELSHEGDRTVRRLAPARVTAAVVACCVVALTASVWLNRSSDPQPAGFDGVTNASGVVGLVRHTDVEDVAEHPADTATHAHSDTARQHVTVALSLFDAKGRRVIGEWNPDGTAALPILCPHRDGIAFRVPAAGRSGHLTPIQAANSVEQDLNLTGFGAPDATWTVRSRTARAATLTAATTTTTTLHASAQSDGTWVITSGQRCHS